MTSGDPSGALDRLEAAEWSRKPNPTWRPMLRRILTLGVAAVLLLVSLLILLGIIGNQLDAQVAILATLMALIPLIIIVPTYLWLDRYEAEPVGYLVAAFLWGSLIAVVGAFFLNSLGLALLVESHWTDPFETGAVYLAPITEETLKGLGIFLIYLLRRHEFDGIIDGIVYAGLIGAGFAFSENILYLGQAYTEMGNEGLTATFIVRGLMGPFGHSLFTSLIGIGIGIAVSTRSRGIKALAILGGWVCAVLLHGAWNLAAIAGIEGFLTAYMTFQVPLFLAFIGFLVWLRRREGRLIGQYLSAYADAGWLTHAEVAMLSHLGTRRAARTWAKDRGGVAAQRSMDAFQDSASDLALLRSRLVHGTAERDAPQREMVLLEAITAHRKDFIGTPVL
jgi:RsiW-degrading membrane proteinase PrsW (M82 family)